jgi:hypothetical protein
MGQAGRDRQTGSGRIEKAEQDGQDKTSRAGMPKQNRQDSTTRTGLPGLDGQDRHPKPNSLAGWPERTAMIAMAGSQKRTARI